MDAASLFIGFLLTPVSASVLHRRYMGLQPTGTHPLFAMWSLIQIINIRSIAVGHGGGYKSTLGHVPSIYHQGLTLDL